MSVSRFVFSKPGDGAIPFSSIFSRMNASTGVTHHARFFTVGTAGFFTGRYAQCLRALSVKPLSFEATAAAVLRGSGAPIFTHAVRSAIC